MIEKMKSIQIVTLASRKEELLRELRSLGLVHLAEKKKADRVCTNRFEDLSRISLFLKDYAEKGKENAVLSDEEFEKLYSGAAAAIERKNTLSSELADTLARIDRLLPWGDFCPQEIKDLTEKGIALHFYTMGRKEAEQLSAMEDVKYLRLASVDKMTTVAVLGKLPAEFPASELELPEKGLGELKQKADACEQGIRECEEVFRESAGYLSSFNDQMLKTQNEEEYSSAGNTVEEEEGLIWLKGYIPEVDMEAFRQAAQTNNWAWSAEDAREDDEHVPTKVRYNKVTRLMMPLFDILGTVPGYHEYDISFWFLGFFALFFAMIIGDAGYGLIFLIGAVALTLKFKKLNNAILLLYVLSIATIVWGSLTGTWLGLESAMKVPFLKKLVVPTFANYPEYFNVSTTVQQNAVMKFCFIIGTVQMALACVMNIRTKLVQKNLSWVADLGWLIAICSLYFVVLYLVIGETVNLGICAVFIVAGFLLVVVFGGMSPDKTFSQGLKAGLADAFTTFLNTISTFGNIMSYIRLFAVGMASIAIAQSFNNMAAGFKGPLVVIGIVIMVIGHTLNIVMGFLSVVVHGVRLNLLEFSGQLGMEWSGTAYEPFRKLDKIKK